MFIKCASTLMRIIEKFEDTGSITNVGPSTHVQLGHSAEKNRGYSREYGRVPVNIRSASCLRIERFKNNYAAYSHERFASSYLKNSTDPTTKACGPLTAKNQFVH
ncbi:hypothetical protein Trydic_g7018 [Trypoxylus dichotomus]